MNIAFKIVLFVITASLVFWFFQYRKSASLITPTLKLGTEKNQLTNIDAFPDGQHKEAAQAITNELKNNGEDPTQYLIQFQPDTTASKLMYDLYHTNNPTLKNRKAVYDLLTKKVEFIFENK